ncbi:MAG: hypothetical protein ACYDA4_09195 [Ignavibacteriaceae bacterium]
MIKSEPSSEIRAKVIKASEIQVERFEGSRNIKNNTDMGLKEVRQIFEYNLSDFSLSELYLHHISFFINE